MASTPPPPTRLRTPPTPRHGAKYDSHEPYSPRRSSRIGAKRDGKRSPDNRTLLSSAHLRADPTSTPRSTRKPSFHRQSSQTFSPPSSPLSPNASVTRSNGKSQIKEVAQYSRHNRGGRSSTEPDSDLDASGFLQPRGVKTRSTDMLPTPTKTPSKRVAHSTANLGSAARALFPPRPATIDDAMPSPRKARMNKVRAGLTLGSFVEEDENGTEDIAIYTDSKERIPDAEEVDENPFLVKKTIKSVQPAHTNGSSQRKTRQQKNALTPEMANAIKNDEGVVYVFRGKKFLRKFDDTNGRTSADEDTDELSSSMMHQAGPTARRPFTRSAITPRLLFPPKEPTPERLLEEEALTDIETHEPQTASEGEETMITPVKLNFKPMTPPTTGHHVKGKGRKLTPESSPAAHDRAQDPPSPLVRAKRSTFLDTWPLAKPGLHGTTHLKRGAAPMEHSVGPYGKRARGGARNL